MSHSTTCMCTMACRYVLSTSRIPMTITNFLTGKLCRIHAVMEHEKPSRPAQMHIGPATAIALFYLWHSA